MRELMGKRIVSVGLLVAGSAIFVWWGIALSHAKPLGGLDFRALYEGTSCLLHGHDPFNPAEVRAYYIETGDARLYPEWALYTLALLNYLPTIYPLTAPFALLNWEVAQSLWTGLTAAGMLVAAFLMWRASEKAPLLSACLIGFLLANSEIILSGGNAAGLTVSLCIIAVTCFLKERLGLAGVLCLAASLAMKPHDGGFIWLFLLLVGGDLRKRACQTLVVDCVLACAALIWISVVAPHWFTEFRSTMAIYSGHGGANDPGFMGNPHSSFRAFELVVYPGMVCNLQSVLAVFRDDPRFYDAATYVFCALFLIVWALATLRSNIQERGAYLALAAIVPITLLVTYHRTTDTKLLLLTVPGCTDLWSAGGRRARVAVCLTGLGFLITGDIPLIILGRLVGNPDWAHAALLKRISQLFVYRPVPVVLLAMAVFYLWVYVKQAGVDRKSQKLAEASAV
jgi:Glycosyltransferase family 87